MAPRRVSIRRAAVVLPAPAGPSITTRRGGRSLESVGTGTHSSARASFSPMNYRRFARATGATPDQVVGAAILLAIAISIAGCVTVKPTQRKELAKPEMTPAADIEEETFHSHVEAAREAGFGGHGAAGGGCGCG